MAFVTDTPEGFVKTGGKYKQRQEARKLYSEGKSYKEIMAMLNVAKSSISLWCRDLASQRVNAPRPDVLKGKENEIRELYNKGMNIKEIAKQFRVNPPRISKICDDIKRVKRAADGTYSRNAKKRTRNGNQSLTNDDVIAMREECRKSGVKQWSNYSKRFNVTDSTISCAIKGRTFKHLNLISPPVGDEVKAVYKSLPEDQRRYKLSVELINDVIALRKENPALWTYGKLAEYLKEKTGKPYRAAHVCRVILNREPELKALEAVKPLVVVKPKPVKKQPPKPLNAQQKAKRALQIRELRAKRKIADEIKRLEEQTKLSREEILSDDDDLSEEELAKLIAAEDAREALLVA